MNVVVVQGHLALAAEVRELPSGDRLVGYEVTIPRPGERAETVPVVWPGAPARAVLAAGDEVVVVGRVRRRFFTAAGATRSSTEIVAEAVVRARDTKRARAAVAGALAAIEAGEPEHAEAPSSRAGRKAAG